MEKWQFEKAFLGLSKKWFEVVSDVDNVLPLIVEIRHEL